MSQAPALAPTTNPALAAIYSCRGTARPEPLPRVVHRMLELFDGARSLGEVCAAVQIPETKGLAVVKKLSSLGLIEASAGREDRTSLSGLERAETRRELSAQRSAFSAAEEAFFASEVQPVEEEPAPSLGERVSLFVSDLVLRLRGAAL